MAIVNKELSKKCFEEALEKVKETFKEEYKVDLSFKNSDVIFDSVHEKAKVQYVYWLEEEIRHITNKQMGLKVKDVEKKKEVAEKLIKIFSDTFNNEI